MNCTAEEASRQAWRPLFVKVLEREGEATPEAEMRRDLFAWLRQGGRGFLPVPEGAKLAASYSAPRDPARIFRVSSPEPEMVGKRERQCPSRLLSLRRAGNMSCRKLRKGGAVEEKSKAFETAEKVADAGLGLAAAGAMETCRADGVDIDRGSKNIVRARRA